MTVVVRLPAIPAAPDTGGDVAVAARTSKAVAPATPAPPDGGSVGSGGAPAVTRPRGPRRRTRFPLATTLLLALAAGASWLAVWRAERHDRRAPARDGALAASAAEVEGDAPRDGDGATASGAPGSVVR
jgi:hypothetical protein